MDVNTKTRIYYFLLIFTLLLFQEVEAQETTLLWEKDFQNKGSEDFNSIIQTSDSNFVCVGASIKFGVYDNDLWYAKLDSEGDTIWTKSFNREGVYSNANDVLEMKGFNGDLLIVGKLVNHLMAIRTDSKGNIKWEKTFGNNFISTGAFSVIQTYNNGFVICGSAVMLKNGHFDWDIWLLSINSRGDIQWSNTYDLGNENTEAGISIIETADSGFVVVGHEGFPFESPWDDLLIMKIDKEGNKLWHKLYGTNGYDRALDVKELKNKCLIISGLYGPLDGNADTWLLKTDQYGDTLWTKKYGGDLTEWGSSIALTDDEGFIVTGVTESFSNGFWDMWIFRTDSVGETLWSQNFGGSSADEGRSIIKTYSGDYVAAGMYFSDELADDSLYYQRENGYVVRIAENLTNVKERDGILKISDFRLYQNYPNPFNPSTVITYNIPKTSYVKLVVYNMLGQIVVQLVNESQINGRYSVEFEANDLPSGIYFYRLESAHYSETKKMLLVQ